MFVHHYVYSDCLPLGFFPFLALNGISMARYKFNKRLLGVQIGSQIKRVCNKAFNDTVDCL